MRRPLALLLIAALGNCALADGHWVDYHDASPFLCRSEFRLDAVRPLLNDLSRLQSEIEQTLNLQGTDGRIEVNIFSHKRSYVQHLAKRVPEGVSRPALFVQGTDAGRIYVYRRSGFETDVRHEATHALLHNALPYVPLWLDEGLAEYFEVPRGDRVSKNPHLSATLWAMRFGWQPDLRGLEARGKLTDLRGKDYRESWAWVHFLLHESPQTRQILHAYLQAIQHGDPPGRFSDYLANQIPNADERLLQHFRSWNR
jgi:hypothetical protein